MTAARVIRLVQMQMPRDYSREFFACLRGFFFECFDLAGRQGDTDFDMCFGFSHRCRRYVDGWKAFERFCYDVPLVVCEFVRALRAVCGACLWQIVRDAPSGLPASAIDDGVRIARG